MGRLGAVALAVTVTLGGCMAGHDFEAPGAPEVSDYQAKGKPLTGEAAPGAKPALGAPLPGQWWALLRSKQLNALIERGLSENADLEAAEAAVRVAHANALASRGAFWPTVVANWNSSVQQVPTQSLASNAASGASTYALHTAQVTVGYVPDVFGGTRRAVEAADALTEGQKMQREAVALTLTSNIALAAIQQASFASQIEATQKLVELQTQLLDVLRKQQSAGQIALTDVLGQETALAQTKLLLPPLERQREQQRHVIAALTGRFPSEADKFTFKVDSFRVPPRVPVSLPADLVRQRPDIRVAEANLRQTNAQIGVAIAARLPQFSLTGNAGSTADSIDRLFSPGTWFWMLAGNVAHTVFDGRTLAYKQKAAEEAYHQATAQYRSVVLVSFQNVADVLVALKADARAITAAKTAEDAAGRNIALVRSQVDVGQVSLPILINAQQAYLQASLARVQAQASRLANIVALFQALGGGWWERGTPDYTVADTSRIYFARTSHHD